MPPPATEHTFIIPVSAADARRWLTGGLDDLQLLLRASLVPEVIFAGHLPPGRAALREALAAIAYWKQRGCRAIIARAQGVIIPHYFKWKAVPVLKETYPDQVKYRFLLAGEVFERYTHFCKLTPRADPPPAAALAPPGPPPASPHVNVAAA